MFVYYIVALYRNRNNRVSIGKSVKNLIPILNNKIIQSFSINAVIVYLVYPLFRILSLSHCCSDYVLYGSQHYLVYPNLCKGLLVIY